MRRAELGYGLEAVVAKARIKRNAWDNWYGYLGKYRVMSFWNTPTETQQQQAERWLAEQKRLGHTVDNPMDERTLAESVAMLWEKMCDHDGIDPKSKFVVFSDKNPYAASYNSAMERLLELRAGRVK